MEHIGKEEIGETMGKLEELIGNQGNPEDMQVIQAIFQTSVRQAEAKLKTHLLALETEDLKHLYDYFHSRAYVLLKEVSEALGTMTDDDMKNYETSVAFAALTSDNATIN